MTRDRVLDCLKTNKGSFFSGGRLAGELGLSRTAVWKAVRQLRDEGFLIESSPKKGYRLRSEGDTLSESGIRTYLRHPDLCLKVYRTIGSTNTALRQLAESGAREGTVLLAEEQTAGKRIMDREFCLVGILRIEDLSGELDCIRINKYVDSFNFARFHIFVKRDGGVNTAMRVSAGRIQLEIAFMQQQMTGAL